jgi:hypothetical protein
LRDDLRGRILKALMTPSGELAFKGEALLAAES